jgi:hypothetical protein
MVIIYQKSVKGRRNCDAYCLRPRYTVQGGELALIPGAHLYRDPFCWNAARSRGRCSNVLAW